MRWLHSEIVSNKQGSFIGLKAIHATDFGLEILQWLLAHHPELVNSTSLEFVDLAAKRGRLEIVQGLNENRSKSCMTKAVDQAAKRGHVEVVQFLIENMSDGFTTAAVDQAASRGHLDIVKCLSVPRFACCTALAMDNTSCASSETEV